MKRQPFRKTSSQIFDAFGFSIPMSDDGRRLWSFEFKRFIAGKLAAKEMTVADVKEVCKVENSQVKHGKAEVSERGAQSRPWRKS